MTAAADRDSFVVMGGVRGRQRWIRRWGVENVEWADGSLFTYNQVVKKVGSALWHWSRQGALSYAEPAFRRVK